MRTALWAYSMIFRYGGLLMAILSVFVSASLAVDFARNGYVLVNGVANHSLVDMIGMAAMPLAGALAGLCLFFFVPRVTRDNGRAKIASGREPPIEPG